jgi:peptidoglycan/LPS O-acetylase OafA/YrhL
MVPGARTESITAPQPNSAALRRPAPRVVELDGLRGIAILLVLVFHFTPSSGPLRLLAHVFQIGWSGVDLFFVLSGYLITGILLDTAGRPHYYRNFFVRRSLRIFPLYYACLLLYAFLTFHPSPIHWHDYLHAGDALWYFFYAGNFHVFLRNAWPGAAILTLLWSLQVEEQFYWSFPFIVAAVKRRTLAIILLASIIAAFLIRLSLVIALPSNLVGAYVLMPCRMDALAMGGLVAIAFREKPEWLNSPRILQLTLLCAAVFLSVCIFSSETPWSPAMRTLGYTALDLAFTGVLILLIGLRRPGLVKLCRIRALTWLGTISYGLYLLHIPALTVVDRWLGPALHLAPRGSAAFCVSFALAIAAASLSWLAFESQVLRLKTRFSAQ